MLGRPTPADILRARKLGVCPWCRYPTEGLDLCPECGHHTAAPLGPPDPGTPGRARVGAFLALALILAVALIQQLGGVSLAAKGAAPPPGAIEPPSTQFELMGRLFVKIHASLPTPELKSSALSNLDAQATLAEDKVRVAMVAAELRGPADAMTRLDAIEPTLPADAPLLSDIAVLRDLYAGSRPADAAINDLKARHGYFGRLAAAHGAPVGDPERMSVTGGGDAILFVFIIVGLIVLGAFLAGFILLIIAIVQVTSGGLRPAFVPPTPGGSIAIEIVAVFALGFLLFKGAIWIAESRLSPREALWFALLGQWTLLAVVLWPRFVGAPRGRGMTLLGWHKGRGIFTEIGCGFVGYLACLPLLLVGAIVSVTLMFIYSAIQSAITGTPPPTPENPILDIASGKAGPLVVVTIYFLATLWAPIVEETIFRGGLYRHLRSRWHWLPAAFVTALGFGIMHAYPILMMGPVIALGFGFAMLREWRGSLIASMTAHCIHNAVVLGVLLTIMRLVNT
jgi:membrane protease YdiL (CAAX protease family)